MTPNPHNSGSPTGTPDCRCPSHGESRCVPLLSLGQGQVGRVHDSSLDAEDSAMLRAMGLRASAKVMLCSSGRPCIVSVLGAHGMCCRIGLAADLASRVMVKIDG